MFNNGLSAGTTADLLSRIEIPASINVWSYRSHTFLFFSLLKILFIYLRERDRDSDRAREKEQEQRGEGEAGFSLSREPDAGLSPRTLGS